MCLINIFKEIESNHNLQGGTKKKINKISFFFLKEKQRDKKLEKQASYISRCNLGGLYFLSFFLLLSQSLFLNFFGCNSEVYPKQSRVYTLPKSVRKQKSQLVSTC